MICCVGGSTRKGIEGFFLLRLKKSHCIAKLIPYTEWAKVRQDIIVLCTWQYILWHEDHT